MSRIFFGFVFEGRMATKVSNEWMVTMDAELCSPCTSCSPGMEMIEERVFANSGLISGSLRVAVLATACLNSSYS